jgi:NitT/TauT family transport system ATP-binding protein
VQANITLAQQINPQNHRSQLPTRDLLELVKLTDFAEAYPFALSGGMQQRVALARTLALGANLWLMDEPFAALDELTRENLTAELLHLWRQFRPTVVWVTHHIYEAARLADRVLVMTPRPSEIVAEVAIDQPRPRDETLPAFQGIVTDLRQKLQVSSNKAQVTASAHNSLTP